MKRIYLIAVLCLNINFIFAQNYSGATLLETIDAEISSSENPYGVSLSNDTIYITSWVSNLLLKFSTISNEIDSNTPIILPGANGIHGNYVDNEGVIWCFDLDGIRVAKYSSDFQFLLSQNIGAQPVNGIGHENSLYIADRELDSIFVLNKSTLLLENRFEVTYLNPEIADGNIDLFVYLDKLYLVSNEINGVVKMNLDGSMQELIVIEDEFSFMGIHIKNNKIYLNNMHRIIVTDLQGNVTNMWDLFKRTSFDQYIDIEIANNNNIYVISSYCSENDNHQILVYQENPEITKVVSPNKYFVNITPNPSNGLISINLNDLVSDEILIEITSVNGQSIYKKSFNSINKTKQIDLSKNAKGIYLVRVITKDFEKVGKLIIE